MYTGWFLLSMANMKRQFTDKYFRAIGIADKMKSVRLVQIFRPIKETNLTLQRLCGGFVDTERAEKMCQDGSAEFISASYNTRRCCHER